MADEVMTVEESIRRTREVFGEGDYGYITEQLLASDATIDSPGIDPSDKSGAVMWGNSPRMGYRTIGGVSRIVTNFVHGNDVTSEAHACGNTKADWLLPELWVQEAKGRCDSGGFRFKYWQ
jgi:hypothetical protein